MITSKTAARVKFNNATETAIVKPYRPDHGGRTKLFALWCSGVLWLFMVKDNAQCFREFGWVIGREMPVNGHRW